MQKKHFLIAFIFGSLFYIPNQKLSAQNIQNQNSTLEKISQLNVVTTTNNSTENLTQTELKLVPEEVEKMYPAVVSTKEDGSKSINYEKLTPILLLSVKELSQKVSRLEKFHEQDATTKGNWGWQYFLEIGFVVIVCSSIFLSKKQKISTLGEEK